MGRNQWPLTHACAAWASGQIPKDLQRAIWFAVVMLAALALKRHVKRVDVQLAGGSGAT